MALLFDVDRIRILRHIYIIDSQNELDQGSTCAENAQVRREGNRGGIVSAYFNHI